MTELQNIRICTITPVRSPINLDSEKFACFADQQKQSLPVTGNPHDQIFTDIFSVSQIAWANGFTKIANDLLPAFFQPLLKRSLALGGEDSASQKVNAFCTTWKLKVVCAELYFYDDTIAIVRLDFCPVDKESEARIVGQHNLHEMDEEISKLLRSLYADSLYPSFCANIENIKNIDSPIEYTDPRKFQIFKDVDFDDKSSPAEDYVLWTGRYVVADRAAFDEDGKKRLLDWAAATEADLSAIGGGHAFIGSGNSLVFCNNVEAASQDWFRSLSVAQVYNAILYVYGTMIKSITLNVVSLEKSRKHQASKTTNLLESIQRRLDHLVFVNLEFEDAKGGLQGVRREIVSALVHAWRLDALKLNIDEKSNFIRNRLERIALRRREKVDRSIEMILAAIGGISLISIVLSLSSTPGNIRPDTVPGLIDLFSWASPDVSLFISLFIVVVMSFLIYRGRR